jgi:two-component system phosphate regulon sensor histidine kinase PhoR
MKHRADEKGIELVKELHERLPEIRASCDDMHDVLLNLLDNALKFTPNGGKVTVGAKREGSEITAWVVDTGIGIPENEQVKLFSKFSQVDSRLSRSSGGIGLGLAICKKILDAHGGSIWVESRPGKGSTFYFKIKSVSQ